MPLAPFFCAIGDSPTVTLVAAATVPLAPPDDSVDTNRVTITGRGTIASFGVACQGVVNDNGYPATVTKRVTFLPDPGQTITLQHNPPALSLYILGDRPMASRCFGTYESDHSGNWQETSFLTAPETPIPPPIPITPSFNYYLASGTVTIIGPRGWVRLWGAGSYDATSTPPTSSPGGYLEKFLSGLAPGGTLVFTCGVFGGDDTSSVLSSGSQAIGTLVAAPGYASGGDINVPSGVFFGNGGMSIGWFSY